MTVRRHLFTPREAAEKMGISYPTIKKCILDGRLKTIKTPGGHHRLAPEDIKAFLERDGGAPLGAALPQISGVNQIPGQVVSVQVSGLVAEITLAIGEQRIRAIVNVPGPEALDLKAGDTATALIKSTDIMIGRF
jgi:molybdopterin-binding protein